MVRADRPTAAFALAAILYAGLFFCVQLVGRGTSGIALHAGSFHLHHARYVLLPFLFLVTALLVLIDRVPRPVVERAPKVGASDVSDAASAANLGGPRRDVDGGDVVPELLEVERVTARACAEVRYPTLRGTDERAFPLRPLLGRREEVRRLKVGRPGRTVVGLEEEVWTRPVLEVIHQRPAEGVLGWVEGPHRG